MSEKRDETMASARMDDVRLRVEIAAGINTAPRACSWDGCEEHGAFKAPVGRQCLRQYIWFCLDHIREYNQRWDYFAGMTEDQIEDHRRADATWHRPTWNFGMGHVDPQDQMRDPFEIFGSHGPQKTKNEPPLDAKSRDMMNVLGLERGYSEADLKSSYKAMAKRHHPDLNGGDRIAEEKLKMINEAYAFLKKQFA